MSIDLHDGETTGASRVRVKAGYFELKECTYISGACSSSRVCGKRVGSTISARARPSVRFMFSGRQVILKSRLFEINTYNYDSYIYYISLVNILGRPQGVWTNTTCSLLTSRQACGVRVTFRAGTKVYTHLL